MSKLIKQECIGALKELSRIRCIAQEEYDREEHAIIMLEHLIKEHFELNEKVDSVQSLLNNKPYEFEELEVNMWVWDEKEQWYRCMVLLFPPCKEYPKGSFKSLANSNETEFDFIEFEPNRFYPREVKECRYYREVKDYESSDLF